MSSVTDGADRADRASHADRADQADRADRPARTAAQVTGIVPQFLVVDLDRAIAYYRDRLGFDVDFIYDSFYASVSRDGFAIHLKHVDAPPPDREFRRANEHLDAHISVVGVRDLFSELQTRGAAVIKALEQRPWACVDFYVEDPDGYVLCFSELLERAER